MGWLILCTLGGFLTGFGVGVLHQIRQARQQRGLGVHPLDQWEAQGVVDIGPFPPPESGRWARTR